MKISQVRILKLTGRERKDHERFEARHEYFGDAGQAKPHEAVFTEIVADDGSSGLCFGGSSEIKELGELLIGEDPVRIEYLWEKMANARYARYGHIHSMGVLDLALWDLLGKIRGEPVFRLLGGQVRDKVPAYAAMLGFSLEPERAAERSVEFVGQGFSALKWYVGYNETHGIEGLRRNVRLAAAVRKAVGDDVKLFVDFANAVPSKNSLLYIVDLAQRLEEYRVSWLEEPLHYDDLEAYKKLAAATRIPLACGEHLYTRWQIKNFLESGAITVYQPDAYFAAGLTELRRMMGLMSSFGVTVIPHANESCIQTAHLLFATPERICPLAEFGVKLNERFQHFFKERYQPREGFFEIPQGPGFGFELDPEKIVSKEFLS